MESFQDKKCLGCNLKLPPTRASFISTQEANFSTMRHRSYTSANSILTSIDGNVWNVGDDGNIIPTPCLIIRAPSGILELVTCSCRKCCTHLCVAVEKNNKFFAVGCNNFKDYRGKVGIKC